MRMRALWLAVVVAGMAPLAVRAQDPTRALDSIFDAVDAGSPRPAVAAAVLHKGAVVYRRAAGFADLERRVPATMDTRFDWASVAKQFTGFAVAQLVEAGALSPGDDARRFLPELDLGGATVTVQQLLAHTSGLDDIDGLLTLAGWRPDDPVTDDDAVRVLLRQQHLRWAPGEQEGYGNGGYALLAEIVARVSGKSFKAYTDSAVFVRLGMRASGFPGSPWALVPDRALPYVDGPSGGFVPSRVDTYVGAGGLYATVDDMLLWARNLIRPTVDPAAVARIKVPGRLASGEPVTYGWGLGLGSYRGRATLGHAGSGVATETYLVVFPDLDFAVVAASAAPGIVNPFQVAHAAADAFLAGALDPVAPPATGRRMIMLTESQISTAPAESEGVEVAGETLRAFAGTYRFEDGTVLVVRPRGGRLEYSRGGAPPFIPLFPVPEGHFVMMPFRDRYVFSMGEDGVASRLTVDRTQRGMGGTPEVGDRVSVPPFSAATAAPYVGWYHSDELGASYEVALGHDGLELRHPRHGVLPLIPFGSGDEFGVESRHIVGVSFSRGGDGTALGMELRALSWDARSFFRRIAAPPAGGDG